MSQHDIQRKTCDNHRYLLNEFVNHCHELGLGILDKVEGYHVEQYKKNHRENDDGVVSARPVRRSAIMNYLRTDISKAIVSGRMSISKEGLDTHYDERTLEHRRETHASTLSERDV